MPTALLEAGCCQAGAGHRAHQTPGLPAPPPALGLGCDPEFDGAEWPAWTRTAAPLLRARQATKPRACTVRARRRREYIRALHRSPQGVASAAAADRRPNLESSDLTALPLRYGASPWVVLNVPRRHRYLSCSATRTAAGRRSRFRFVLATRRRCLQHGLPPRGSCARRRAHI